MTSREAGRGKRYPESLQARAVAWLQRQVAAGESIGGVAKAIGIRAETARRWLQAASQTTAAPQLVAVEIVSASSNREFSVVSPSGFRVDGLTFEQAATLLRLVG